MLHSSRSEHIKKIALKYSVFNEHVALRRSAFIIHVYRSPLAGKRSVVDGGNYVRSNLLSKLSAKFTVPLRNARRLKRVDACLMKNNSAEAAVDNDRQESGRALRRMEHRNGRLGSLGAYLLHIDALERLKAHAQSGAFVARLRLAVLCRNCLNKYARSRASVLRPNSV